MDEESTAMPGRLALRQQQQLLQRLQLGNLFNHAATPCEVIETHISWVILTGRYAYKMKKALNLGFLDYSTLAKRKFQCEEELRLNRRTAPELYLEVIVVGGTPQQPELNKAPAIEYMVKMQQFSQQALLSAVLASGELTTTHIEALAQMIADFHASVEIATADSPYGTPELVNHPVHENFTQIRERISAAGLLARMQIIEERNTRFAQQQDTLFAQRKQAGFIRDCHGDLHLNNILLLAGRPRLFDCIEFNPALRIIDVISELAFLVMDLQAHHHHEQANLLLNHYLECSGDYEGIRLLRFYLCYRAMVRAKVVTIRLAQSGLSPGEEREIHHAFDDYLKLAEQYSAAGDPHIYITHGLSGSGKSTLTATLMQRLGAIRIRSDVERQRLFATSTDRTDEHNGRINLYSAEANNRTYQRLAELATAVTEGGYPVIIDATFLQCSERDRFRALADKLGAPFTILHFHAQPEELKRRIQKRVAIGKDASEADIKVLQGQLSRYQPLGEKEMRETVVIDTQAEHPLDAIELRLH